MSEDLDWEERGRICREALRFLHFLCGSWSGQGVSQGQPVTARFDARLRFGDTFIQCEERLWDADGKLSHEDLALIRMTPDDRAIRVTHAMAHAWVSEQFVRPLPASPGFGAGAFWYAGPFSPRVLFQPVEQASGDALQVRVTLPDQPEPDTLIRYQRGDGQQG